MIPTYLDEIILILDFHLKKNQVTVLKVNNNVMFDNNTVKFNIINKDSFKFINRPISTTFNHINVIQFS